MEMMSRPIEFRMWNCVKDNPSASRMFYDPTEVMACLTQQILFDSGNNVLGYDHVGDGNVFMQFTGLHDRNGVKVFEGDLVCIDKQTPTDANAKFLVEYGENASFNLVHHTYSTLGYWGMIARAIDLEHKFGRLFVMGNIHEPSK